MTDRTDAQEPCTLSTKVIFWDKRRTKTNRQLVKPRSSKMAVKSKIDEMSIITLALS